MFTRLMEFSGNRVRIGSGVANITIAATGRDSFKASYRINNGWRGEITGYVFMDKELLRATFGLIDDLGKSAEHSQ